MGTPVKISGLPAGSNPSGTEVFPAVQSGTTVKLTLNQIKNWIWSIFLAKGSLITATASGTPAELAVGTDGQTLKADSGQAKGLIWAAGWSISYNHVLTGPTAARTFTAPDSNTSILKSDYCHVLAGPTAARTYTMPDYDGAIPDGAFRNLRVYTANDTWTKPTGLKRIKVTVVGGGGGGGGRTAEAAVAAGGGAAGGTAIKIIEAGSLGATETVTIGTGGSGGTAGANDGAAGGTSSFGAHCQATGGGGGPNSGGNTPGPGGGVGSGGDLNLRGGQGGPSTRTGAGIPSAGSGFGGTSSLAGGAPPSTMDSSAVSAGAEAYGAGGGGAVNGGGTISTAGGNGTAGVVIVEEFY